MEQYNFQNPNNKTRKQKVKPRFSMFTIVKVISCVILIIIFVNFIQNAVRGLNHEDKPIIKSIVSNDESYYENKVNNYVQKLIEQNIYRVIDGYKNLGIVKCDGFVNVRNSPNVLNTRSIIGLMTDGSACEILDWDIEKNDTYCKIQSGGMTGYIAKQYVLRGEEARKAAYDNVRLRAIILVDKLRMRSEPSTEGDTQLGSTYKGERYNFVSRDKDWIKIEADNIDEVSYAYINANDDKYVEVALCLNEARTQNLKNDVVNYYDNIGVSMAKDYLNIRKTASSNGAIVGKLPGKGGCEILGSSGDFYKIKSGVVTGYVSKKYLATGKKAESLAIEYADLRAIVKIPALKVRTKPDVNSKQWTTITKEETYIVTNQLDGWVEIELDGGDEKSTDKGYVSTQRNYVEVRYALEQAVEYKAISSSVSSARKKLVEYAMKYVGNPYVWGGTSLTSGCDCSGFVQQVFKAFGRTLPRVSKEQAKQGTAIKNSQMKPGDLIFYANSNGVVDHVAIYIGNNQIVHAASTKSGIKISKWNYRTPIAIRNILGK